MMGSRCLPEMENGRESPQAQVLEGLQREVQKEVPCSLLYDDRGSELYEKITELEEYYPFRVEEYRLKEHAQEIAAAIPDRSVVVELGCGTARKSSILLTAVQKFRGRYVHPITITCRSFFAQNWIHVADEFVCMHPSPGASMWALMCRPRFYPRRARIWWRKGLRPSALTWWKGSICKG